MKKISSGKSIDIDSLMKEVKPSSCILDIGCAHAEEREVFRKYYSGPIYFFEADMRWEKELSVIEKEDNCFVERSAVNNYNGEVTLYRNCLKNNPELPGTGNTIKPLMMPYTSKRKPASYEEGFKVPCITLDSWSKDKNIDVIDLMWVDVEGAEKDVFEGGEDIISKTKYIYFEYCHLPEVADTTLSMLTENILKDFSVIYIDRMNALCKRRE